METNNKLREALGKILWCLEWMFNNTDDKSVQSHLIEPIALAKAALAEPPRNCDVGTANEQEVRFDGFCMAHKEIKEPGLKDCSDNCPFVKKGFCDLHWAQMPYEEGVSNAE